jgi:hypothetical protein
MRAILQPLRAETWKREREREREKREREGESSIVAIMS